jgi:Fuc2NAc and GlcNAc transferase
MSSESGFALLGAAFAVTMVGTWGYRSVALHRGIVAEPNFRSLHHGKVPRGGGLVFAVVCLIALGWLTHATPVAPALAWALVGGGPVATVFGFVDDAVQVRAAAKFLVQGILAAWILYCVGGRPLWDLPFAPSALDVATSWVSLVWLMNVHNFVDGIDGLAASGALVISLTAVVLLALVPSSTEVSWLFGILAACSAGFLVFNWPPASLFMGDAGSLFLGFCFSALMAGTVTSGDLGLWTWLVMFGFVLGDTTTTTLVRLFVADKWYGEHRSHAYQNLARLWGSHVKVVRGVWIYHLVWLLPLAVWAARSPETGPLAAALALLPVVVWTLRHGPLRSSS